jgi:Beta protein
MTQRHLETHPEPSKSSEHGYVPVLQDHAGERDALASLRVTKPAGFESVIPVVEIVGRKTTPMSRDAVKGHIKRLVEALGTKQDVYLDFLRASPTRLVSTPAGRYTTAEIAYDAARRRSLRFMPVAWSDSRPAQINAAANAAIADGRGLALRHRVIGRATAGASMSDSLRASIASLQVSPGDVDLLLDLGFLDPDVEISTDRLARLVTQCAAIGDWRRMVLMGSSIPASLGCVPEGGNGFIERREWQLWSALPKPVREILDFGDYGIQHPTPPKTSGPGMRANIRYSVDGRHFIVRGRGEVRIEGAAQYVGLCERILTSGFFAGEGYSWGDQLIKGCAEGVIAPGDQTKWRAAGTAHHIRLLTEQTRAMN